MPPHLFLRPLLLLLHCFSSLALSSFSDPGGRAEYRISDPSFTCFTHLTVHSDSGDLYIGAVNRILKLSADLKVQAGHATGPAVDNKECYPAPIVAPCEHSLDWSNNVNKLLLVDYSANRLLACGTKWQGVCKFLSLDYLFTLREPHHLKQHYVSRARGGMAGVIVKHKDVIDPDSGRRIRGKTHLFIGTAVAGKPQYFPSLSSRSLYSDVDNNDMLSLVYQDEFEASQIKIPLNTVTLYPDFDINYIYAFSSGSFVYFIMEHLDTELTKSDKGGGEKFYTSKIVRLCSNDKKFHSYVEFPLGCTKDGVEYRLVQAAFRQKAGKKLALALGLGEDDDVLFVVFAKGQQKQSNPLTETVLCLFTLRDINRVISERIRSCYRGEGRLSVPWLFGREIPCIHVIQQIGDDFCGLDVNQPLGGRSVIQGHPLYEDRAQGMGAVAGYTYREDTVVFVGTRTGQLKKFRVDGVSLSQNALLYTTVSVVEGEPILRDMAFSPDHRYIYVLSPKQVTRLPVDSCDQYSTCSECLGSGDPHCGWCAHAYKCSRRESCDNPDDPQNFHLRLDQCVDVPTVPKAKPIMDINVACGI
ncbi:hypothetical protein NL108_002210 [Boleophthalmus pectinirostris]|uniref:plexin A3-like n=1 Tax=Boleophthalmus pectinirostris TaxID=150288 RepID=UPI00242E2200|nr:plexin A3-like [Boleophthalmus pectinirostris]KAJ0057790.1 hypothetical protein NL108_002210 [Boleophthalmus pectinirostris]